MSDEGEAEVGSGERKAIVEPIKVPKGSDILAGRLRDLILAGEVSPGDPLPTERELVKESGLSRSSVREALRALEIEGLISTRPGRAGGSMVQRPGRGSVARSMEVFVKTHGIRLDSLLECRFVIEPFLAGMAAERHTEEELAELTRLHEAFAASADDVVLYKRVNLDWHLAVARASGNEVLTTLMEAIAEPIYEAAGYREVTTLKHRRQTIRVHGVILAAIAERDRARAEQAMANHIRAYVEVARRDITRAG